MNISDIPTKADIGQLVFSQEQYHGTFQNGHQETIVIVDEVRHLHCWRSRKWNPE